MRLPMETYGGTNAVTTTLADSSPVLNGKTVVHCYIGVDEIDAVAGGVNYAIARFGSPYVLDLLQYQNGSELPMGQAVLPAQSYSQYRLVLNAASTQIVFSDGTSLPVSFKTNSGSQSSANAANQTNATNDPTIPGAIDVTVNAPFTVDASAGASVAADFNVLESLTVNNNNVFVRPSMFVANHEGQLRGQVLNTGGSAVQNAVVVATASSGVVSNSAATDANGNFNLHALPAGTYQLTIFNAYTTAAGQNVSASGQSATAASVNGPTITVTAGGSVSIGILND
ncbi:MAG TPA: DUF4382 domain-containing protein [Candidatus Baltobacteraceae bacterium]|nr:DUF4382 domain-containing protein [Candidatus Baltobacteraceae bacterium]